ncbi:MAG: hypothetical protein JSS10_08955 [Verrucomicrobia bacterium]|nr:hypothetical protein [Verrucomicrobiota bacterium]
MQWKLNKIWPSGGLILITGIAQLHADASNKNSNGCDPMTPAQLSVFRPVVTAEALFWNARQEGLVYTLTSKVPVPPPGVDPVLDFAGAWPADFSWASQHAKNKTVPFGWDWGFRVGLGGLFQKHGNWDLMLTWTWYRQSEHSSIHQTDEKIVAAPMLNPLTDSSWATSARARWHLHFETLDLELGHALQISKKFSLRPHGGLRGAWIHQRLKTHYDNVAVVARAPAVFKEFDNNYKNNFNGAGIRMGIEPDWSFAKHWKVYGDFSASFLYGQFLYKNSGSSSGLDQDQYDLQVGTNVVTGPEINVQDHITSTAINFDIGLGLSWDYAFSCNKRHLTLMLGYEYHLWLDQNQIKTFVGALGGGRPMSFDKSRGDLSLMGLTFGAKVAF